MTSALVIDDEAAICRCFETLLSQMDCDVRVAASAEDGLQYAAAHDVDLVVLDIRLPGMDGLSALPRFREHTTAPIVVMTAHGDLSTAVSAVQQGAFEYLPKPFDLDHVKSVVTRALAERPMDQSLPSGVETAEMVGQSPAMQQLFRQIALAAQHDAPVLITGESGTGKELVAHAIHRHSRRSGQAIVPVHLASVSEGLMERELFGHVTGAFTGADQAQDGLMTRADGGSLFLDEIGEASPAVQVKLLRTIETGQFYPVGSANARRSDFRLLAATNRSVEYLKSADVFRSDFFYRLSTIHIHVPPLRERPEDIPLLADHFLGGGRTLSEAAIMALQGRCLAGNVRELRNLVLSAAAQSPATVIAADQLPSEEGPVETTDRPADLRTATRQWARQALAAETPSLLSAAMDIVQAEVIAEALEHTGNNRTAAAAKLGIHRETLRERMREQARHSESEIPEGG
ncbi:MAG: sigma-54 dependent transcriptional regulator [Planctomycetaceae bacterium]|nr:sigma-54 dependent transcriptional regulator [Planctomycetaceae bacterium]